MWCIYRGHVFPPSLLQGLPWPSHTHHVCGFQWEGRNGKALRETAAVPGLQSFYPLLLVFLSASSAPGFIPLRIYCGPDVLMSVVCALYVAFSRLLWISSPAVVALTYSNFIFNLPLRCREFCGKIGTGAFATL